MQCESHNYKKVTHKCVTCKKFVCGQCSKPHIAQRHEVMTCLQLADILKSQINQQINRMNSKITQLCILKEYESGEAVIDGCMNQILEYVKKLFQQIKLQYRKISDNCWRQENIEEIRQIQEKKNIFQEWRQAINKKPDQATHFDAQKIYQSYKIDSDEDLFDESQSFILNNLAPKVQFNETALRRANQSLTKIIYTQTKYKAPAPKKVIKKISSKKSLSVTTTLKKTSLCKFVEGTNMLFQYILQDPEFQQNDLTLSKIQFRQFIAPLRSAGITLGSSVYLIGGYGKQNKPKKQIYLFERAYTSMRIIGLLKQGRVGHALCSLDQKIYIFGGKMVKSLEVFNTKTKTVQIISQSKYQIIGSSMTAIGDKLYVFGGTDGVQINKNVLCFNIQNKQWQEVIPLNIQIFSMPISPILQGLSQYEILIYGGYFTFSGQSYNNNYMILYDTRHNYLSVYGKGELIYPILCNGDNSVLKDNKIYCLADLKRQRDKHGPNLPVIFTYSLAEQLMRIDSIGL